MEARVADVKGLPQGHFYFMLAPEVDDLWRRLFGENVPQEPEIEIELVPPESRRQSLEAAGWPPATPNEIVHVHTSRNRQDTFALLKKALDKANTARRRAAEAALAEEEERRRKLEAEHRRAREDEDAARAFFGLS